MKLVGIIGTAVLSLTLGAAAPAYAQQEEHGQQGDHAQQEDKKAQQEKPAQKEEQHAQQEEKKAQQEKPNAQREEQHARDAQPARQDEHQVQQENQHAQQQERNEQQRTNQPPQRTPQQQRVQESAWREHRSERWDSDHRTWQQRGGYSGYRIPDDRFRGYFGPEHGFRIVGLPFLVVGGYPRFQYGGYWCSLVDPWPGNWAANWYDTDDVYVVYVDNGYYLFNRSYPNVGIAISFSL